MFIRDKDTRDVALVAVTSGILAVSCLGIMLFFLTRPRKRTVITPAEIQQP
jgi:hypothetical protein